MTNENGPANGPHSPGSQARPQSKLIINRQVTHAIRLRLRDRAVCRTAEKTLERAVRREEPMLVHKPD